jgi:hypothetical protein
MRSPFFEFIIFNHPEAYSQPYHGPVDQIIKNPSIKINFPKELLSLLQLHVLKAVDCPG